MAMISSPQYLDGSWGEAGLTGAEQLLDEGVISDLATQENVSPGATAVDALRDYAEQGYDLIVAHSFDYGDDVKQVAAEYPDTLFVYASGFGDVSGNVGDYAQPFSEPACLMGILAAGYQGGGALPYVVTLIALLFGARSSRTPSALAVPWARPT